MINGNIEVMADGTANFTRPEDARAFLSDLKNEAELLTRELIEAAGLREGQILVVGCSSSEVTGNRIGKASIPSVADALLDGMLPVLKENGIYLAAQCCEHLNRALIIEEELCRRIGGDPVCVRPVPKAGGSFAAACYQRFSSPVAVEHIKACAGIDIGDTLIGMHLHDVAVPIRLSVKKLGEANIVCAYTRPKFIGGIRAIYE